MLQNLLTDRFGVKLHWETKETPGFALVVGKNGPKLHASPLTDTGVPQKKSRWSDSSGRLVLEGGTLSDLATSLRGFMRVPVVDATSLKGFFDIALQASPDSAPGLPETRGGGSQESPFPSIFSALKDLGLNLESRKLLQKLLIVDSANRVPTEN